jgi:hypothetical protein
MTDAPTARRTAAWLVGAAAVVLGVFLNPWLTTSDSQWDAVLALEASVFLAAVVAACVPKGTETPAPTDELPPIGARAWTAFGLIAIAWGALARHAWHRPRFITDDEICLRIAATWGETRDHLFRPFNEHLLVPTRLWAYLAVQTSSPESLPYTLLAGLAVLWIVVCGLVFLLARREFRSDALGLATTALFAITYIHHECWWWFMAGQWLWPAIFLLAALLILDPAKPTSARVNAAALLSFVALFAYSIGVLVGVVAALWILVRFRRRAFAWRPLLGMALGLALAGPTIAAGLRLDHPDNYNIKVKWFAFDGWSALATANRLVVDHLLLHNFGVTPGKAPAWLAAVLFPAFAWAIVKVVRRRPILSAPYLAIVGLTYAVVVPFRSWNDFPQMTLWAARYHLLPQLGLAFLVVSAFPRSKPEAASLGWPAFWRSAALLALLIVIHETGHGGWIWRAP